MTLGTAFSFLITHIVRDVKISAAKGSATPTSSQGSLILVASWSMTYPDVL